jgi:predicted enzyme related to lactoylglutathione lyase
MTAHPPSAVRDGYPSGVPCWVDLVQADLDATMTFYGGLFGWTFAVRTPDGAPQRYAHAHLDGLVVAGIGGPPLHEAERSGWTTYVWVDSTDATVEAVERRGGHVTIPPVDIPHAGRPAVLADPSGAVFGVWQAAENRGVQLVNVPGSWNFSELNTNDAGGAEAFYGPVFGWELDQIDMGGGAKAGLWRRPGYGDHLAERDPGVRERQASDGAPPGFVDAVALLFPLRADGAATPHWSVTFAVADADASIARAVDLGATVVVPAYDTEYTRMGTVRDPQGAELTLSQYRPPQRS